MKISQKLILGFLGIASWVAISGYISITVSQNTLQKSIGFDSKLVSDEIMDKIDRNIYSRIEEITAYSRDITLQKSIIKSNEDFDNLNNIQDYIDQKDKEWIAAPKDELTPFMLTLLNNELSRELREKTGFYEKRYGYRLFGEIFATNKYGANVGQTGKTTDYRQDDEEWWQNAKENGLYAIGVNYDKSSGVYSTDFGIRIDDEKGNFIGAIKAVLNIEGIIDILKRLKQTEIEEHKSVDFKLLTHDGRFIYSTEKFRLFEKVPNKLFSRLEQKNGINYFTSDDDKSGDGAKLYAYTRSKGYKDYKGLGWILLVEHEKDEVLAPVNKLKQILISIFAITIIFAVLTGIFLSRSIGQPIKKLRDLTTQISKGQLNISANIKSKDEIGDLAASFDKMAGDLRRITISKDYVDSILGNMIDALVVLDKEAKIQFVNQATLNLLGYKENELICKSMETIIYEERKGPFEDTELKKLITKGSVHDYDMNYKTKSGDKIPVSLSMSVVRGADCQMLNKPADSCPEFREKGEHCKKTTGIVIFAHDMRELLSLRTNLKKT